MVKRIKLPTTRKQLERQIAIEEAKGSKRRARVAEQADIKALQIKLKGLRGIPPNGRTGKLLRRTSRGFKGLAKKATAAAIRQGKRIRKQQLRDEAAQRKSIRKIKKGKGKRRQQAPTEDFFGGIPGFGFGN